MIKNLFIFLFFFVFINSYSEEILFINKTISGTVIVEKINISLFLQDEIKKQIKWPKYEIKNDSLGIQHIKEYYHDHLIMYDKVKNGKLLSSVIYSEGGGEIFKSSYKYLDDGSFIVSNLALDTTNNNISKIESKSFYKKVLKGYILDAEFTISELHKLEFEIVNTIKVHGIADLDFNFNERKWLFSNPAKEFYEFDYFDNSNNLIKKLINNKSIKRQYKYIYKYDSNCFKSLSIFNNNELFYKKIIDEEGYVVENHLKTTNYYNNFRTKIIADTDNLYIEEKTERKIIFENEQSLLLPDWEISEYLINIGNKLFIVKISENNIQKILFSIKQQQIPLTEVNRYLNYFNYEYANIKK